MEPQQQTTYSQTVERLIIGQPLTPQIGPLDPIVTAFRNGNNVTISLVIDDGDTNFGDLMLTKMSIGKETTSDVTSEILFLTFGYRLQQSQPDSQFIKVFTFQLDVAETVHEIEVDTQQVPTRRRTRVIIQPGSN